MAMTQASIVVGVFTEPDQARSAIDELRRAGFRDDEIGFLTRVGKIESPDNIEASAATGAVSGGVLGGLLGAGAALLIPGFGPAIAGGILAATLGGVAIGAAAGSIIGTLTGMGVSEREAEFYQRELEAGRTVVTVKSQSGQAEAMAILRRNDAYDATTQYGAINATPPLRPYNTNSDDYDPTTGTRTNEELLPPPDANQQT